MNCHATTTSSNDSRAFGGAVAVCLNSAESSHSAPQFSFQNCMFENNSVHVDVGFARGSALFVSSLSSSVRLLFCHFFNNMGEQAGTRGATNTTSGGSLWVSGSPNVSISGCEFHENRWETKLFVVKEIRGSAISVMNCTQVLLEETKITKNKVSAHFSITRGAVSLTACRNVTVRRCTFDGNSLYRSFLSVVTFSRGRNILDGAGLSAMVCERLLITGSVFGNNVIYGNDVDSVAHELQTYLFGGGLAVYMSSQLRVEYCVIHNNGLGRRVVAASHIAYGGGMHVSRTERMTMVETLLEGNTIGENDFRKATASIAQSTGGGIYVQANDIVIQRSVIVNNRISTQSDFTLSESFGAGAATVSLYLLVSECIIGNNTAAGKSISASTFSNADVRAGGAFGGGMALAASLGLVIESSYISNNKVTAGQANPELLLLQPSVRVRGGGLDIKSSQNCFIFNSVFDRNEADSPPNMGEFYFVQMQGGALSATYVNNLTVVNCTFAHNAVGKWRGGHHGFGGAIALIHDIVIPFHSALNLISTSFIGNSVTGGSWSNASLVDGGHAVGSAVFSSLYDQVGKAEVSFVTKTVLDSCLFSGNTATGGSSLIDSRLAGGDALSTVFIANSRTVDVRNCSFADSVLQAGSGTLSGQTTGALCLYGFGRASLIDVQFANISANHLLSKPSVYGGHVFGSALMALRGCSMSLSRVTVKGSASVGGFGVTSTGTIDGLVLLSSIFTVQVSDVEVEDNWALGGQSVFGRGGRVGGVLCVHRVEACTITNSHFTNNVVRAGTSRRGGGGNSLGIFRTHNSNVTLRGVAFRNNTVEGGRGLDVYDGGWGLGVCYVGRNKHVFPTDAVFEEVLAIGNNIIGGCSRHGTGGGAIGVIYTESLTMVSMKTSLISNNSATAGVGSVNSWSHNSLGGGLCVQGPEPPNKTAISVVSTVFQYNTVCSYIRQIFIHALSSQ